jgi:hypothetical protein
MAATCDMFHLESPFVLCIFCYRVMLASSTEKDDVEYFFGRTCLAPHRKDM